MGPPEEQRFDLVEWVEQWRAGLFIDPATLVKDSAELSEAQTEIKQFLLAWRRGRSDATARAGHPIVGRYTLQEHLGCGALSESWKAYDEESYRLVTVKLSLAHDEEHFLSRAALQSKLTHKHIIPVLGYGRDGIYSFLVSPFVSRTLTEYVARSGGRLPPKKAKHIARQVAHALEYLRRHGIVHRDVKPENILVDDRGRAYLTDFDIALTVDELAERERASSGSLLFMAPEQYEGAAERISFRTDLYALSVVSCFMLTGAPPFSDTNEKVLRDKVLHAPVEDLHMLNPLVPLDLSRVVTRGLSKDPQHRFTSGRALSRALMKVHFIKRGPFRKYFEILEEKKPVEREPWSRAFLCHFQWGECMVCSGTTSVQQRPQEARRVRFCGRFEAYEHRTVSFPCASADR